MLVGSGLDGGRSIGGYGERVSGELVDLTSGDVGDTLLTARHLGATLLALGDVDPKELSPITGVLA
ncbi:MAG: hypothetical protein GY913_12320 [Proteobacteria bacterium]|nr:hypothetical protein [Pseudomonadota bacterium]